LTRYRGVITTCANASVLACAYVLSFLLRFDFALPPAERTLVLYTLPAAIAIQYLALYSFKLTRGWWRYVGVADFLNSVKAAFVGNLGLAAYILFLHRKGFPRSIFLIDALLVVGLTIGARLAVRLWRQYPSDQSVGTAKRLLIIGAGDTGEALLREIRQSRRLNYHVVAFVDDDPAKRGAYINGVAVVDRVTATEAVVARFRIDEIVVATPSASGTEMRAIIDRCRAAQVPFKVMPATWEVLGSPGGLLAAREVDINDLLRRPPVELDLVGIGRFLKGKRVLVTGAAGSIGSEICRQLGRFHPSSLLCLDHDENALFLLERSLASATPKLPVSYRLADITDPVRLDAIFAAAGPQVVFHAAAHKHVPMLEGNPVEGIRNNVFGTELVATLAGRHGTEAFVLISTDKAVNPSSVMGTSKRIAELLVQTLPFHTRYTAVRFGNVLGSQGSVVPLFKDQIAHGGPVTVTHPDMSRYFMTIPEAVELVIQAAAMGRGEEVFLLDMGEPVKIVDLASDLITLSGLRPGVDIAIEFSGIRPGEKMHEELYLEAELADRTTHPKILVAKHRDFDATLFTEHIAELRRAVDTHDEVAVRRLLPLLVPEYARPYPENVIPISSAHS
jgi:FlaA1/EpsC-like NDP-sugar epimerase